ncbi:MAG: lamin tail domain-containing protein [Marinicellaceae bacterium]
MKYLIIVGLFCVNAISPLNANTNIKTDLDNGLLPVEAARNAHDNDEKSQDVVQQFVDENVDIVKAVQTVAKEWSTCEDTYAAVRKGVQLYPQRADEIVAAVATIRGCRCNAQSFWARSRLEQRLRPRIQRALVEISSSCSCASAGIEAAIEVVPSQTEDMIDAIIVAKNRAARTADSIGQIGVIPENRYWGDTQTNTKDTNLIRNTDICKGDHDEHDEFEPVQTWGSIDRVTRNPVFNDNKELGKHRLICKEEDDDDDKEKENKDEKIIISQYLEGQSNNQALELYNGSNETVDLLLSNYQIEIYFHGYEFPGEVIQLKGIVEPQSTFVISDANAAADITNKANQKVNGLIFKGADAIVLKAGIDTSPCECSVSTVASAINAVDKDNNEEEQMSETKKDFIQRIEQHYENTNIQTTIIDSIGQILVNDNENDNEDQPIVEDKTLRRVESICKGDRIEMDEFLIDNEWQSYAADNFLDSGNFSKEDCLATRKDLLLSEFVEGTDKNSMIELYNGTDRTIDFSVEKYFLEIFNDDDSDPDQKIYLDGKIENNGVFVISHDNADDDLKDISQQVTGQLDLENARAVVLKKVVLPAYQACYADIADWLIEQDSAIITYTLPPIRDPGTGPTSDDLPLDGDDGGELASPN